MVCRSAFSLILLVLSSLGIAQGQTPTKEYIYMGGKLVAIENPSSSGGTTVQITSGPTSLTVGTTAQYTANTSVTWTTEPAGIGSFSPATGTTTIYTAPATVPSPAAITIRATSQQQSDTRSVTIVAGAPRTCTVSPLTLNFANTSGSQNITLSNCTGTGSWSGSVQGGATWLRPSPTTGTGAQTVAIQVDASPQGALARSATIVIAGATVTVNQEAGPTDPGGITVTVNPTSVSLLAGREQQFQGSASGTFVNSVNWSLLAPSRGTLVNLGGNKSLYTAPYDVVSAETAIVRATEATQQTAFADATVNLSRGVNPTLGSPAVTPSSGSGKRQTFAITVNDLDGNADIMDIQFAVNSDWGYSCHVQFNTGWNMIELQGGGTISIPGSQTTSNSFCTLYGTGSSVDRSVANALTLRVDLEFQNTFAGLKNLYVATSDYGRHIVGFSAPVGSWRVPAVSGVSQAAVVGISAPSQVNPGQDFSATVQMKNTGQDIWQSHSVDPTMPNGDPHMLGSALPRDNATWGRGRVDGLLPQVLPGQTATFAIDAKAPQTQGSQSFGWQMVHERIEWFGPVASSTIQVGAPPASCAESSHPYSGSSAQTWTCTVSGNPAQIDVTFDAQTNYPQILLRDGSGNLVGNYFNQTLAGQTVRIPGSTVRIELPAYSGSYWGFRANAVAVTGPPPVCPAGFYDDFHSCVSFSPGWIHDTQFGNSPLDGTISYNDNSGASASMTFTGSAVTYHYTASWNRGYADVYIDGVLNRTLDLYSSGVYWRQSTYIGGLGYGTHTIDVVVKGTKNSQSQGYFVDLDGFTVH